MNAGREGDVNRGGADSRNRNNGNGSIVSRGRADGSNGTILTNARSLYLFLPPSLPLSLFRKIFTIPFVVREFFTGARCENL